MGILAAMRPLPQCPKVGCRLVPSRVIRWGTFHRQDDCRKIPRYRCNMCAGTFSTATWSHAKWQKKRRINNDIRWLLCMKVSRNALAQFLKVSRETVTRKLLHHAKIARAYFENLPDREIQAVQFDELHSTVHTKCKPVQTSVAVCAATRRVLALCVASAPAQAPLDKISKAKYGERPDERPDAIEIVLHKIRPLLSRSSMITTDKAFLYPEPIARILPFAKHVRHKSRKARFGGQGELKRVGFDPLFTLNHTAAMSRDRVGRMVRKTWGTSKRQDRHEAHMLVWAHFHNEVYLPLIQAK